ncbi:MAG: hypothetical protein ACHQM6_00450, partial [Candidatus Kapaibacterium sp.]
MMKSVLSILFASAVLVFFTGNPSFAQNKGKVSVSPPPAPTPPPQISIPKEPTMVANDAPT